MRATALLVSVFLAGCQATLPSADRPAADSNQSTKLPPVLARMQRHYPDLHSARFLVLADFNTQDQAELMRVVGPDGTEENRKQPTITVLRSIDQTGAGGLKAELAGPNDKLIFDGARSGKLALIRDWRAYQLLLFSSYGPDAGVQLTLEIQSGIDQPRRWSRTLFAGPGWQTHRIDLASVGLEVDLADVRALTWTAPAITNPLELYIDDVIITDNTRHLMGRQAADGELSLYTAGRRIHVGARGRFDLAFANGTIVDWRSGDSANLTVPNGLGPWPVPLPDDWYERRDDPIAYDDPALFARWGGQVAATQRIVEYSPLRVVIEGIWRFESGLPDRSDGERRPQIRWNYVVYPTGEVFVQTDIDPGNANWTFPKVGHAIALSGQPGFTHVPAIPITGSATNTNAVLYSLAGREQPDLLWCLHQPGAATRQVELGTRDRSRIAMTVGDIEAIDAVATAHLLRFWPPDMDGFLDADSFARDYQQPTPLEFQRGSARTDQPGDLNGDGFNESEGWYELSLDDGLARFRIETGAGPRRALRFRVLRTHDRDCWIYADGRVVQQNGRDAAGDVIFAIPPAAHQSTLIEINTKERDAAAAAQ